MDISYFYFKENCKSTAIDLNKQQALYANSKRQQINFTGNLDWARNTVMLFPSNMIGNANFKTNFLHKLLLNNRKFATF